MLTDADTVPAHALRKAAVIRQTVTIMNMVYALGG